MYVACQATNRRCRLNTVRVGGKLYLKNADLRLASVFLRRFHQTETEQNLENFTELFSEEIALKIPRVPWVVFKRFHLAWHGLFQAEFLAPLWHTHAQARRLESRRRDKRPCVLPELGPFKITTFQISFSSFQSKEKVVTTCVKKFLKFGFE